MRESEVINVTKHVLPTMELIDKCPHCHKAHIVDLDSDEIYGLAKLDKHGKLDDKTFIQLKLKKCPECGAIFFFEEN